MTDYHNKFIPFPDVYSVAGPDVFGGLEGQVEGEVNLIVLPLAYVENLDQLKNQGSMGAEETLRFLQSQLQNQVEAKDGIYVYRMLEGLDVAFVDDHIFKESKFSVTNLEALVRKQWPNEDRRPLLLTNVEKYHIKFGNRGLKVQEPQFLQANSDVVNEGIIIGSEELHAKLQENRRHLPAQKASEIMNRPLYPNQFIKFLPPLNACNSRVEYAVVKGVLFWNKGKTRILDTRDIEVRLFDPPEYQMKISIGNHQMEGLLGIAPNDMEQYIAMQYAMVSPDISLVILAGSHGSGKTLLSYVSAVDSILFYPDRIRSMRKIEEKGGIFKQIVLLKPNDIIGGPRRGIGDLPGSMYDKLRPFLESYSDAHRDSVLGKHFPFEEMLKHPKYENKFGEKRKPDLKINGAYLPPDCEALELTYSGFMRGRSFKNTILVMDEAQNYTPYELKTCLQRLGEGCKCIILGDPLQKDNPQVTRNINGLTYAIKNYLKQPYSVLVKLSVNYRHQIAEDSDGIRAYNV
ncbi:MAG: PhoH family protein [Candidatus Woesearchaeota archaeon]